MQFSACNPFSSSWSFAPDQASSQSAISRSPYGPRLPVPIIGAFAEMPSDMDALADVTASAFAAGHIQFISTSAAEAKGMYKQRIRAAWGHAAHRGTARLLLDSRRDLIVHGPRATRNAGGKFDDEEQQWHEDHHYHHPRQFHARASD